MPVNLRAILPAILPVLLTASHVVMAADAIPKFDVERTCRPAAVAGTLPGRDASACQKDENDARARLEQVWSGFSATQRAQCAGFASLDGAPSYVELLTCLEMAQDAHRLPAESKVGTSGTKVGTTGQR